MDGHFNKHKMSQSGHLLIPERWPPIIGTFIFVKCPTEIGTNTSIKEYQSSMNHYR